MTDGNSQIKEYFLDNQRPHPTLTADDYGWTFKESPIHLTPRTEYTTRFISLRTNVRQCPLHGEQAITSCSSLFERQMNYRVKYRYFSQCEGLACGCEVAIHREADHEDKFTNWRVVFHINDENAIKRVHVPHERPINVDLYDMF